MNTLAAFEAHLRATCGSPRTVIAYTTDSREFLAFLGNRLADIDAVEEWVASLSHRPQTIARKLAAIRRLLGYLARHGDEAAAKTLAVVRNYKLTPAIRQADKRVVEPITRETYYSIREAASPLYRALFDVLWWTGGRISEVVGDAVADIPPLGIGSLRALVERGCVETVGKGGKRRTLFLPSVGRDTLQPYVESLAGRDDARAFPVTAQAVNAALHRLGFRGGCHSFRHAYRARLRQAGISEEIMRHLMGHGPKDVTAGYGMPSTQELVGVVDPLD